MKDLSHYQKLAERMIEADRQRDRAYQAYDDMYHSDWSLPKALVDLEWVRKVISTDPHDAISAGTRVLSSLEPRIKVLPLADNQATKRRANEIERVLAWHLKQANSRRQGTIERDVVHSALRYDEITCQVIDLDYQIKQKDLFGGDSAREKAARRFGRFAINVYNPSETHVRYSSHMPEAVLLSQEKDAVEVVNDWGEYAKGLKELADQDGKVTLYDYMDYSVRAVWAVPGTGLTPQASGAIPILGPEKHELPFLAWAAIVGGSTIERDAEHKRHPLLYSIYRAGQWETANVVKTLYTSEVIAHAAAPRGKEEGPNPDAVVVDYGDPARTAKVPPGNAFTPLPPPAIDRALSEIDDRLAASIDKATVSRVLQNGDVPSGTAFSTLNLATQTAVGALKPYKELAEKALAQVLTQMMLWAHYTQNDLRAYGTGKTDRGREYVVKWDEIDPEGIYIEVELTPDIPTDRQARIQGAVVAQQIGLSKERALEEIGVPDPEAEMKQTFYEQLVANKVQMLMRQEMAAMDMQIQQAQQEAMMQAQAQAQAQMGPPGIPGIEGAGFDPAAGGLPPAMMMPGATREQQTGADRMGVELA